MPADESKAVSKETYRRLVQSIKQQIAHSQHVIEQQTVATYWSVGRSMQAFLKSDPQWGADAALARRLSKDIGVDVRTLQQALQFYRVYPQLDSKLPLSWSHYRVLMTIGDPGRRVSWEKRAVREGLGIERLRELIRESEAPKADARVGELPALPRGELYHYRLLKVSYVNESPGGIMLDCGFDNRIVLPPFKGEASNKRIVRAVKEDGKYGVVVSKVTVENIFAYKAIIERVVDGDTILANIDCGFGLWTRQYLRLNWIDAPELRSAGGLMARDRLKEELSPCPFVVVKTRKSDKFDRYLADIYYLPGQEDPHVVAAQGKLANQVMLDQGLAELWLP